MVPRSAVRGRYLAGGGGQSLKIVLAVVQEEVKFSGVHIAPVDTHERGVPGIGLCSCLEALGENKEHRAIPQGSRTRKPPPSRSSVAMPAARTRSLTAATSSGSSSTTVQWRRPTLPSGTGGTPSPRQMLKPRWWW